MKYLVLTLISALFCSSHSFAEVPLNCPAGDKPLMRQTSYGKRDLILCVDPNTPPSTGLFLSNFKIYSMNRSGAPSTPHFIAGPLNKIKVSETGHGFLAVEMITVYGETIPSVEQEINCNDHDCKRVPGVCVFKKPVAKSTLPNDQIQEYITGDRKGQTPSEQLMTDVADLAFTGDLKAQSYFQLDSSTFNLNAGDAEKFVYIKNMIEKLSSHSCF